MNISRDVDMYGGETGPYSVFLGIYQKAVRQIEAQISERPRHCTPYDTVLQCYMSCLFGDQFRTRPRQREAQVNNCLPGRVNNHNITNYVVNC
ncbi:hypothetical protein PpBr36_07458 [Pyricularia pennisetigena]|uniref:hypothetical protein n=1 Tax=Pyricularia pennisetigena TaxID=1578925 RepID=UPI0011538472|nr:hypothetical protein PpBr36_07458 [Pyricularia pennisetigena]TLS25971.1 hypothetical protein PpBr36_07458 [Pyricularia pennisetigena]